MWQFIRNLFRRDRSKITILLLDEEDPSVTGSLKIDNWFVLSLLAALFLISGSLAVLAFFITPLGSLYSDNQVLEIRSEVVQITQRLAELHDSLDVRDRQMEDIKRVIRMNVDTLYAAGEFPATSIFDPLLTFSGSMSVSDVELLKPGEILSFSSMQAGSAEDLSGSDIPEKLLLWPSEGTLTQPFLPEQGHYGIDIATGEGVPFMSVETGRVIHTAWTVDFGYVLLIQHRDGMISIYKHASSLNVQIGDTVLRGQMLGTVGDRGFLSSGSHLHLEIWVGSRPLNPVGLLAP